MEPGRASSWGSSWATSGPPIASAARCRGAALGIHLGTCRTLSENAIVTLSAPVRKVPPGRRYGELSLLTQWRQ
jgi:hypothetical protein